MAEDLTGVPTGELRRSQAALRNLTASVLALWAAVVLIVLALFRKGLLSWPDLAPAGWHG